jgi:tRNA A-37 threonylcarbamoyl transferase component Bud32
VVKLFRHRSFTASLKVLLRGTPAGREWKNIHQALQRGLPTAKPLAVGRTPRIVPRESVLITELLKEAVPVDVYLFGPSRSHSSERRRAIQEIAALIRRAHDAGFRQRDFHLGNILIRPEPASKEIFLIDFQHADFLTRPTNKTRWRDLAALHGGSTPGSRSDRLRFLHAYLSAPPISVDLRTLVAQLERRGLRHRYKLWQRRAKRCLAANREFVRIRQSGFRGSARRADWTPELEELLKLPSAGTKKGEIVKDSRTTTVAALQIAGKTIYLKRYNYQGWPYALKDLFRSSRARRVWVAANSCDMRGIAVAPPLAYLERRRFGFLLESHIVTAAVHGEKLSIWLKRHAREFHHKRALIHTLARLLRRMHDRRIQNRDLKSDNLIVQAKDADRFRVFIVDIDGVRTGARVSWRRRVKNLTRLERGFRGSAAITRTDRLRFLRSYLGPRFGDQWKMFWRGVSRRVGVD